MYIYESHLGGLYTTHDEQDWEDLHCEQCGDSDFLIDTADTIEEAWAKLKPDTEGCGVCDTCVHDGEDDGEYCNTVCNRNDAHFGTWDLLYMMDFLYSNFECQNPSFVYVISYYKNATCVEFKKYAGSGETYHTLPHSFCISPELADTLADHIASISAHSDFYDDRNLDIIAGSLPEFIGKLTINKKNYYIYGLHENDKLDVKINVSSHNGHNWVGFLENEALNLAETDKMIFEYFTEKLKS